MSQPEEPTEMNPEVSGPMETKGEGDPTGPNEDTGKYVEGVECPADLDDVDDLENVAFAARSNGAPQALVERIRSVGKARFSSVEDVLASL